MLIEFNKPQILNDFENYLKIIKRYSLNTINNYSSSLLEFFVFIKYYLEMNVEIENFNSDILFQVKNADVIAFLVYLNYYKNNGPYTRQHKLSAIRTFYKWLFSRNPHKIDEENPTIEFLRIKKIERVPKFLNLEQAEKIQKVFTSQNAKFPNRDNAIISLLLSTGIRVGELVKINIKDINFNSNSIIIHGKGNIERMAYFSEYCKKQLQRYIKSRYEEEDTISINAPLFIHSKNKRIKVDLIEKICAEAYKLIGLENCGYTVHTLRHTAATLMYAYVTPDIYLIKDFLGHSSIQATEIYVHVYDEQLKNATDKNPLSNVLRKKLRKANK